MWGAGRRAFQRPGAAWNDLGTPVFQTGCMNLHRLHASYILRLRQRLSRLSFELRDVRTGQARCFDSTQALASFLDGTVTDACGEPAPAAPEAAQPGWNALGTPARHARPVDEPK